MRVIANVVVGEPQTHPSKPSHTPGVREGNKPRRILREPGFKDEGLRGSATGRRSTGINAKDREPIDPRMPTLTPA
jgi:hypothetical protein